MRPIATTPFCVAFAIVLAATGASAFPEEEPNDTVLSATPNSGPGVAEGTVSMGIDPDFYVFTDLAKACDATIDVSNLGIGRYDENGELVEATPPAFPIELLDLLPDANGEIILAVCPFDDTSTYNCDYSVPLLNIPYQLAVPEPTAIQLEIAALLALLGLARRRV